MAANEPTPGSGSPSSKMPKSGSADLLFGVGHLTSAVESLNSTARQVLHSMASPTGTTHPQFSNSPSAQQQWEATREFAKKGDRMAAAARARDRNRQEYAQSAGAPQPSPTALSFPKMPLPPAPSAGAWGGSTAARERMSQQRGEDEGMARLEDQERRHLARSVRTQNLARQPSVGFPTMGSQAPVGGGADQSSYAQSIVRSGWGTMSRAGITVPPTGGGAAGAGKGGIGGMLEGKGGAIKAGIAGGLVTAGANAINNYSQRMLNTNFDQFGNLYTIRNGGYSGQTYGDASSAGINKMRPVVNVATSPGDMIAGSAQILVNSGTSSTFSANLRSAGQSAYITAGQGIQTAAANQQAEGTNKANVAAQGMLGVSTRLPGGGQMSESQLADAILNATRGGQGMAGMSPDKMAAMLSQVGSLRSNINTYAQSAGLDQNAVDSLANNLTAKAAFQAKYGNTADFDSVVQQASTGNKGAISKLKGTGIGESVEQSILTRQGAQTNRDMNSQKEYINELKSMNSTMTDISNKLTSIMNGLGISSAMGWLGGANSATGGGVGKLGKVAGGALAGAAIGSFIPGVGTLAGGLIGGAWGFISGGAEKTVKGGTGQNATAAPANVSTAANSAIQFAQAQLGKPYVMGAAGPNAFDCSGLTQAAYQQAGVSIPRVSSAQSQFGTAVPLDQIAPGDLVFPKGEDGMWGAPPGLPGHVMMALSGGPNVQVVQAGSPSSGIYDSTVNVSTLESARRVTNGVGTLSPPQNKSDTGGSNTNTNTSAGKTQATGTAVTAMNEVDILGAVLGRAAFQGPGTLPSSAQLSAVSGSINGTANKMPGYASGAMNIEGEQLANLHDGEMVLNSKQSRSVRAALMADIPTSTHAGSRSGPAAINFASGAIQVSVTGVMTQSAASDAARQIVDAMAADDRLQQIGVGL